MEDELFIQLNKWHETSEYNKIIEKISTILPSDLDFDLISHFARAYNNIENYDKALEILMSVSEEGKNDKLWNFRVGYAYFYKGQYAKALVSFEKSSELGDEQANMFKELCKKELGIDQKPGSAKSSHKTSTV